MAKKFLKYVKKNPVKSAVGGALLVGVGYVGYKGYSKSQAFRFAAAGEVNAMAAQKIGEMLPAAWKDTPWYLRNVLPSSLFKAATSLRDFFKPNLKTQIFKLTETVTDKAKFEHYFQSMWGFSFYNAVSSNLSTEETAQVYQSMSREKIRLSSTGADKKGLVIVSDKTITANDISLTVKGSIFSVNKPIPPGMVIGVADGRSLKLGTSREGYVAMLNYRTNQGSTIIAVLVDKTKVKFLTAAEVARKKLPQVPPTYIATR